MHRRHSVAEIWSGRSMKVRIAAPQASDIDADGTANTEANVSTLQQNDGAYRSSWLDILRLDADGRSHLPGVASALTE